MKMPTSPPVTALFPPCTFHSGCSNSSLLLLEFSACLVFHPILASPVGKRPYPPTSPPENLHPFLMHITSFKSTFIHMSLANVTIAKYSDAGTWSVLHQCRLFVLSPSDWSVHSLILQSSISCCFFWSSLDRQLRAHSVSCLQPGFTQPPTSNNLPGISLNSVNQGFRDGSTKPIPLAIVSLDTR